MARKMKDQEPATVVSIRTYDNDGYLKRAAAVCIRDEKGDEVLLVTSKRPEMLNWVIPGGGIEPGECPADAAEREVFEEAGVKGAIVRKIGVFQNEERKHRTSVYLFRVMHEYNDWEDARRIGRVRRWFPIVEARSLLGRNRKWQADYLDTMSNPSPAPSNVTSLLPAITQIVKDDDDGRLELLQRRISSSIKDNVGSK